MVRSFADGDGDTVLFGVVFCDRYVYWELDFVCVAEAGQGGGGCAGAGGGVGVDMWGWFVGAAEFDSCAGGGGAAHMHEVPLQG